MAAVEETPPCTVLTKMLNLNHYSIHHSIRHRTTSDALESQHRSHALVFGFQRHTQAYHAWHNHEQTSPRLMRLSGTKRSDILHTPASVINCQQNPSFPKSPIKLDICSSDIPEASQLKDGERL